VQIQEEVEGTQLELHFEGAMHYDVDFHQLITDILNSESALVVDTQVVSNKMDNGTHSVIIDLDCDFTQCAPHWRNETQMSIVEQRVRQDSRYSDFTIVNADVEKMDGQMNVVEVVSENDTYLLLAIGVAVMLFCVMGWKYWKLCFFNKNLDIDMKEYVDEVIAVEHRNHLASVASLSSVWVSDTEMHSDIEGCETLAVVQERERDFAQPAPVNYDVEGFAPTIPEFDEHSKRILGGESGVFHKRRDTEECAVDVYVDSPSAKRVPVSYKKSLATMNSGDLSESDTDITLYGYQHTTTSGASGSESVLDAYWSPRTAQGHNMTWE